MIKCGGEIPLAQIRIESGSPFEHSESAIVYRKLSATRLTWQRQQQQQLDSIPT